ncbi:MAG: hypothetical protein E7533_03570 [Ruminococcaceae bacterium]|nr:hypothetical protein [Oscillospiraceae bacterium]
MTVTPKLSSTDVQYALYTAKKILNFSKNRRAGSPGEQQAQNIILEELSHYCDSVSTQGFKTHPGAGTLLEKLLCCLLIFSALLFCISTGKGLVAPVAVSLIISLVVFCVFSYKIVFDGKMLDFITPSKRSKNILGIKNSGATPKTRVVLVARTDSAPVHRFSFFGKRTPYILSLCAMAGNTLLFVSELFYLFSGAPENSTLFKLFQGLCLAFIPIYMGAILLVNNKKTTTGLYSSIIPSVTLLSVAKKFFEESFRYPNTEICFLFVGSDYSSHAGSYAFAKKYKRVFRDIPTFFICLEEIEDPKKPAIIYRDSSGTNGSTDIASIISDAAENLNISTVSESFLLGTGSYSPFAKERFPACSLGTTQKTRPKSSRLTKETELTVSSIGELLIEALNYFDGEIL